MKLTLFEKIVISTCLVATLIFTMVVPCFASSYTVGVGDYRVPLFSPRSVILADSDADLSLTFDLPTSVIFSSAHLFEGDFTSSLNAFEDLSSNLGFRGSVTGVDNSALIGYGYNYVRGDFDFHILPSDGIYFDYFESPNVALFFGDVYLPVNLVTSNNAKLNWLGSWFVNFKNGSDFVVPLGVRLNYNLVFIDKSDDKYVQTSKSVSVTSTFSAADTSQEIGGLIYDSIQDNSSRSDRLGGVVIQNLVVNFYDLTEFTDLTISGENKYISPSSVGFGSANTYWNSYRNVNITENVVVNNDTVVGGLVNGINSIWNLQLFGEFTIGALFSAVVGLSLFIWLLKIFAGG